MCDPSLGPCAAGLNDLQEFVIRVINLSVGVAFLVLFIMLLVAGVKYITSGGDPKALQSAQGTLTWAVGGIAFLALAWIALKLIEVVTGAPVTQFCLGFDCIITPTVTTNGT